LKRDLERANMSQAVVNKPILAFLAAAAMLFAVGARAATDPTLPELLDRAGQYVVQFERDFALLISDEDYNQRVSGDSVPGARVRRTHAEMLFMWLPEQWSWLTVRNVLSVDSRPVADSQDRLNRALASGSSERMPQIRALRELGARFNLGSIFRTINDPTLALLFLDPKYQYRFKFALKERERVNGIDTWKIGFDEEKQPTIIQDNSSNLYSYGSMWVRSSDGVVVRTELAVSLPLKDTIATVTTDYRWNTKLEMWVPGRMSEGYTQSISRRIAEHIECVAEYSNFRRFETSSRVIAPPN
jgi:hypothetical protein